MDSRGPDESGIEMLRGAAARAVAAKSLRSVAKEVGLTAMGLRAFLDGGRPRDATADKLRAWYVRQAGATRGPVDAQTFEAALTILVDSFPPASRPRARKRVLAAIRKYHRELGTDPPGWMADG